MKKQGGRHDNNAAERALRGIAVGRKNWLFAGSDQGGPIYSLVETAKLNKVDPEACEPQATGAALWQAPVRHYGYVDH